MPQSDGTSTVKICRHIPAYPTLRNVIMKMLWGQLMLMSQTRVFRSRPSFLPISPLRKPSCYQYAAENSNYFRPQGQHPRSGDPYHFSFSSQIEDLIIGTCWTTVNLMVSNSSRMLRPTRREKLPPPGIRIYSPRSWLSHQSQSPPSGFWHLSRINN